jgi:hypothetical protein
MIKEALLAIPLVIGNDPGGNPLGYYMIAQHLQKNAVTIEFKGYCRSACTLYLTNSYSCIHKGAKFGFHSAKAEKDIDALNTNMWMYHVLPDWVTVWIRAHGGFQKEMIVMPYSYAAKHMRKC